MPKAMMLDDMAAVRVRNAGLCFSQIQRFGATTISELSDDIKISRPTVVSALRLLTKLNLVMESTSDAAGIRQGRPARFYDVTPKTPIVMAVCEGAHTRDLIIARLSGDVLLHSSHSLDESTSSVSSLINEMETYLSQIHTAPKNIAFLTVAVSGTVDDQRTVLRSIWHPYLVGDTLNHELSKRFPAFNIENDVNLAAFAETYWGAGVGCHIALFMRVSDKINTGLCLNGTIHRGAFFNAGEIADFILSTLDQASDPILSGFNNGIEHDVASLSAIVSRLIDPDVLILHVNAEEASIAPEKLLAQLNQRIRNNSSTFGEQTITLSAFGERAGVLGALVLAFQQAIGRIFDDTVSFIPTISLEEIKTW